MSGQAWDAVTEVNAHMCACAMRRGRCSPMVWGSTSEYVAPLHHLSAPTSTTIVSLHICIPEGAATMCCGRVFAKMCHRLRNSIDGDFCPLTSPLTCRLFCLPGVVFIQHAKSSFCHSSTASYFSSPIVTLDDVMTVSEEELVAWCWCYMFD